MCIESWERCAEAMLLAFDNDDRDDQIRRLRRDLAEANEHIAQLLDEIEDMRTAAPE